MTFLIILIFLIIVLLFLINESIKSNNQLLIKLQSEHNIDTNNRHLSNIYDEIDSAKKELLYIRYLFEHSTNTKAEDLDPEIIEEKEENERLQKQLKKEQRKLQNTAMKIIENSQRLEAIKQELAVPSLKSTDKKALINESKALQEETEELTKIAQKEAYGRTF